jgi:hypothetical protein
MSKNEEIKAVELVRRIRDEQAKKVASMSESELLAFYRRAAAVAREDARAWQAARPPSGPRG